MKTLFFSALTLLIAATCTTTANAQNNTKEEAAVLKAWNEGWQAFQSGDETKMWSFYTDNACEVYPDGSSACGVKSMKASFEQFKAMLESKPSWTMAAPKVTLLSNDVALILCDVTSDIKLKGGQQIGGKTKFSAILQKVKGNWLLAFDSQTPIMQMPGAGN